MTIIRGPGARVLDPDTMNFETSRAVLVTAAHEIRVLDGSSDPGDLVQEV